MRCPSASRLAPATIGCQEVDLRQDRNVTRQSTPTSKPHQADRQGSASRDAGGRFPMDQSTRHRPTGIHHPPATSPDDLGESTSDNPTTTQDPGSPTHCLASSSRRNTALARDQQASATANPSAPHTPQPPPATETSPPSRPMATVQSDRQPAATATDVRNTAVRSNAGETPAATTVQPGLPTARHSRRNFEPQPHPKKKQTGQSFSC